MLKCTRHGEILFVPTKSIPKGLTEAKTKVIMQGSHGNNHSFDNGKLYLKQDGQYIFGYFKAKNTSLLHPEHSPNIGDAKLSDGNYEIRKQQEYINKELIPIID